ncbi:hypothetical protein Spirs_2508 [Sediminispirochaeta smaragdinae DSM 11293]|uniref:Uncharacterized protein n=2 Tax=Sediminispirochaeta TaxID=1911556 RepID=E1R3J0_SEDSS|nr:hypothetical protein Spirs_2508 [Sediminispirochaeta smaragdinae DSM 11293]
MMISADCKDQRVANSIRWLLYELEKIKDGEVVVSFYVKGGNIRGVEKVVRDKNVKGSEI